MSTTEFSMTPQELSSNAAFLHAYIECSNAIQEGVKAMLSIVFDKESTDQERDMAMATIADSLYPNLHK